MANYDFTKDIHTGEAGEKIVVMDLETLGLKLLSDNKTNTYDLLMDKDGREITYEVKTDVLIRPESDTGNMFIEFESRYNPSGISTSKAEWFVTFFQHLREIWYIRTTDLIQLLAEIECPITESAGDIDSNTKGYLLNRYKYQNKFIVRRVPKSWLNPQN